MSLGVILIIVLAVFFILAIAQAPIALALGASGFLGILLLVGWDQAGAALGAVPLSATAKYALFVIPMFVLMGAVVAKAGIAERIYYSASLLVRRLPGGLPATAVLSTAVFSGVSGSSAADVATMGRISVTEMRRHGYSGEYAAAIVAAAGTCAALIPPAIGLVIYGIVAEVSIGAMLLAGIVPGVLSVLILVATVVIMARIRPEKYGPSSAKVPVAANAVGKRPLASSNATGDASAPATAPRRGLGYKLSGGAYAAILFLIVAVGIYAGFFTATEAGAIGATAAILLALSVRGKHTRFGRMLVSAFKEAVETTSMIFLLLIGGSLFSYFVVISGLPRNISRWITDSSIPPLLIVAAFTLVLLILGTVIDGLSILLLAVPIMAPIVLDLGFSGVWFGILVLKTIEIGLITPPVGLNVFIMSGIVKDVPVERIFVRVTPFVVLDIAITTILFLLPVVSTWLPDLAGL